MFGKQHAHRGRAGRGAVASIVSGCGLVGALAVLALVLAPGAGATPIPYVPTVLPTYMGQAVAAQPIPPPGAPQNPFSGSNPFGMIHLDPWQSDTSTVAGPLGRAPTSWSSRLVAARRHPLFRLGRFFECGTQFDSHGRLETACAGAGESSLVLVDPVSLRVLAYTHLPVARSTVAGFASAYFYLDKHDRAVITTVRKHIWVVAQAGTAAHPRLKKVADYDLSNVGSGRRDKIQAIAPDWQGRIWFVTHHATVGVFDPAKYPAPDAVHQLALGGDQQVSNGHAVTPDAGYFLTSQNLYRVAAGSDGVPHVVWSAPYQTIGKVKPGQTSLGSGTSPTILDHGRYVAIADNANQLHVVVYRTAAALAPGQRRTVCRVPVFPDGRGADENSLIGSGRSLIAVNTYGYRIFWLRLRSTRSEPGVARVDIDANGNGCHRVWSNGTVENIVSPTLSTKTGLVYLYARRVDPKHPLLYVWYWTAVDFRTGKTVWQRLAGTGRRYDSYLPAVRIGPKGILYFGAFDGLVAMRDTL